MNIFVLSSDVNEIARWQIDKHCVKMILESAQMLSSAHRYLDGELTLGLSKTGRSVKKYILPDDRESILYGMTHVNHPSTAWTRANRSNYEWHYKLFLAMLNEYEYRYGKKHACWKLEPYLRKTPNNISDGSFTLPTPAMDEKYLVKDDIIASYRNYYVQGKAHLAAWTKRERPDWYETIR